MVGLNCAACHVGEMTNKGIHIRIDGAQNFLDTWQFFAGLIESAEDPAKLVAFIAEVRTKRAAAQGIQESRLRTAALRLLVRFAENHSELLKDAVAPIIKKIVEDEKTTKPIEFDKLLTQVKRDGTGNREAVLKDFKAQGCQVGRR